MNFELTIRHIIQMTLGVQLRVQMIHFAQFCGKRTTLRLVINEITARASRDFSDLKGTECGVANVSLATTLRLVIMLLLLMVVGVNTVWGQTDYSGTYYIRNMQATNAYWYLVPCMGSGCYYQDNEATPFITTYQTNQDKNSLWRLEKVSVDATDYYRIIHNATCRRV